VVLPDKSQLFKLEPPGPETRLGQAATVAFVADLTTGWGVPSEERVAKHPPGGGAVPLNPCQLALGRAHLAHLKGQPAPMGLWNSLGPQGFAPASLEEQPSGYLASGTRSASMSCVPDMLGTGQVGRTPSPYLPAR
jgi:hypothetical protein